MKCISSIGRVIVAGRVGVKRISSIGRVLGASGRRVARRTDEKVFDTSIVIANAGQIGGRNRSAHILRRDGIRRGRELLAWRERGEIVCAIGAHRNLQPIAAAVERIAKINQRREQAVADGDRAIRYRPGDGDTGGVGVKQREGQVVGAAGRAAVVLELALIRERRALGEQCGGEGDAQERRHEGGCDFGFHLLSFLSLAGLVFFNSRFSEINR